MHMLLMYLGNVVGRGHVKFVTAKLEAIINYLVLSNKKEIMSFLGMSDYYRKFYIRTFQVCANLLRFSLVKIKNLCVT